MINNSIGIQYNENQYSNAVRANSIGTPNNDRTASSSVNNDLYSVNKTCSGSDQNRLKNSTFANRSYIKKLKRDSNCLIDQFYECVPPPIKPPNQISDSDKSKGFNKKTYIYSTDLIRTYRDFAFYNLNASMTASIIEDIFVIRYPIII